MESTTGDGGSLIGATGSESLAASWPAELDTGVPILDEQHRLLDRVLLSLCQTLQGNAAPRDLAARIEQLQCLVIEHFETEEAIMEMGGYPHLGPHRAEHEVVVERLRELHRVHSEPNGPPLVGMIRQAREMLLSHVRNVDMDYAEHLQASLVPSAHPSK